jgi:hypothetical protein
MLTQSHYTLGAASGLIYQIFSTYGYGQSNSGFRDVTSGTNNYYPATTGYDLATGIGVPDAWHFAQDAAASTPPLSSTPVTTAHAIYGAGTNGHLLLYNWTASGGWTATDLTAHVGPAGFSIVGSPSAFVDTATLVHHVFATAGDGNVYELCTTGGQWHVCSSLFHPSGVSYVSSPSAFAYTYPGETSARLSVSVIGSNGHLYNSQFASGVWTTTDLTAQFGPSTGGLVGDPSGYAQVTRAGVVQEIYARGANTLYEYAWAGQLGFPASSTWTRTSLPAPSGITLSGSPAAFAYSTLVDGSIERTLIVLGTNGHVYSYQRFEFDAWSTPQDVTAVSATPFVGNASGDDFSLGGFAYQDVYVFSASASTPNGALYEYNAPLGATVSAPAAQPPLPSGEVFTGSPTSFSYILSGTSVVRHSAFFPTGAGKLHEMVWVESSPSSTSGTWSSYDESVTLPPGVGLSGTAAVSGYSYNGGAIAPPTGNGCSGTGCNGTDPYATGCYNSQSYDWQVNVTNPLTGTTAGVAQLWWSPTCQTNWTVVLETATSGPAASVRSLSANLNTTAGGQIQSAYCSVGCAGVYTPQNYEGPINVQGCGKIVDVNGAVYTGCHTQGGSACRNSPSAANCNNTDPYTTGCYNSSTAKVWPVPAAAIGNPTNDASNSVGTVTLYWSPECQTNWVVGTNQFSPTVTKYFNLIMYDQTNPGQLAMYSCANTCPASAYTMQFYEPVDNVEAIGQIGDKYADTFCGYYQQQSGPAPC